MSVTEKTSTSWFARMKSALAGIIVGFVLVIASAIGIFWNEGHAVATYKALDEGAGLVVSVAASPVDGANEGKLVHVSGDITLDTQPVDDVSGLEAAGAVALVRKVEMYQWVETKQSKTETKLGGGEETVTTYSYAREWSEGEIDSSAFKQPGGHENPPLPLGSGRFTVETGMLGDFEVAGNELAAIASARKVAATPELAETLGGEMGADARVFAGAVFLGANSAKPQIGDLRVSYERLDIELASFVARQADASLQTFTTTNGTELFLKSAGKLTAADLFAQARADNAFFTWIIRIICLFGLFISFSMIFSIIGVIG
ncbi:MAG: TMEM43 family protein, partial [Aestuariivirgaceae bacterium]|nr:TMEM43 family protein [Aestuariivirgaceae bacterium]